MEENEDTIKQEHKKIEIITGNGELNISPVYEHIEVEKPQPKEIKEIVIPEIKDTVVKKEN